MSRDPNDQILNDRRPERILLSQWKKRKLGPFYIIRPPILSGDNNREVLKEWLKNLYIEFIKDQKSIDQTKAQELLELGVSDLYSIEKEEEDREYKVNSSAVHEFIKAHTYEPLEFPYKVIAVWDADDLGLQVANKWLKTLEEPQANITTLFITSSNRPLLSTLESRAITLRLSPQLNKEAPKEFNSFLDYISHQMENRPYWQSVANEKQIKAIKEFSTDMRKAHILLDQIKYAPALAKELYELCHEYVSTSCHEGRLLEQWLTEVQWFQKARTFNNAPGERFLGLFQIIQEVEAHRPT